MHDDKVSPKLVQMTNVNSHSPSDFTLGIYSTRGSIPVAYL